MDSSPTSTNNPVVRRHAGPERKILDSGSRNPGLDPGLPGMTDFIVNFRSRKIARTQYSISEVLEHSRGNPWIFSPQLI